MSADWDNFSMFSFSNGSLKKLAMPVAVAAAMCIAILGAAFSVRQSAKGPEPPRPQEDQFTFMCDKCSAVFTRVRRELPPRFMEDRMSGGPAAIDCPMCGAKASAYLPHRCPNCGKYYLTDESRDPLHPRTLSAPPERCPHCGTDPREWHLKNVKPAI